MKAENYSKPLGLTSVKITDDFWGREQELVRTEVIPYQWEALNDRIPDAAPSYCMRNFKVAGRLMREKKEQGEGYEAPAYTYRGFEALPESSEKPEENRFYGFVFQDSDFAKWIEAVGYTLASHPDAELEKTADEAIDIVCAAQAENGYLDTYYIINGMDRIFTNLRDHHELYCFGHLAEGAIAYYQATGKDKLLKAVERYADFISSQFGPEEGKRKGYPGHEIAEMALARLYEATGERKYLELGSFFLDERGKRPYYFDLEEEERAKHDGRPYKAPGTEPRFQYQQAHQPVREQSEAVGHAVRAGYLYSGMADMARLTGDEEMFAACQRLWDSVVREKLYITGGIGGTPVGEAFSFPWDLPNDMAYSETCAAIGLAFFARRMLQIQADSQYADVMEQALYNTVLAGMALDGKSFFYVNPLEVYPEACRKDERRGHVSTLREKWFGCACCPPNLARIVSSVGSYVYTQNEATLYTHLYVGSQAHARLGGRDVKLTVDSRFPWDGEVRAVVHVEGAQEKEGAICQGTLAFRIPGWCGTAEAEVREAQQEGQGKPSCTRVSCRLVRNPQGILELQSCGEQQDAQGASLEVRLEKGYLYFSGCLKEGDQICLSFPMEVRCVRANTRVRQDIGKVAFTRGPICYCMEEADNGKELQLLRVDAEKLFQGAGIGEGAEAPKAQDGAAGAQAGADSGRGQDGAGVVAPAGADSGKAQNGAGAVAQAGTVARALPGAKVEGSNALGHEMCVLKIPGLRQAASDAEAELYTDYLPPMETDTVLTFIPYYAWNNRGEGEMSVWVRM